MAPDRHGRFLLNEGTTRIQYGALCWRADRDRIEVMLITSRETGRWVIPKGWPIAGLRPEETALREAWEEAGVEGVALSACLGLYPYFKVIAPNRLLPCIVAVYPVQVMRLRTRFPERKERRRAWFPPLKAAQRVEEDALQRLIAGFRPGADATG